MTQKDRGIETLCQEKEGERKDRPLSLSYLMEKNPRKDGGGVVDVES